MKKKFVWLALLLALAIALPATVSASTPFRDVPATHFAFEAINWVSHPDNGGIMVGDPAGNFHPNQVLNKFEAARIFAMAAGYRPVATHAVNETLRAEIQYSFEQWRPFLDEMWAQHPQQWSRIADREIAFLLHRDVLSVADVQGFLASVNDVLRPANLTRQEAIAWLVRLIGRSSHAQAIVLPYHSPFADDEAINPIYAHYVYYAREAGIIAGGSGGNFNPESDFTRAQMAVVIFNALSNPSESQGNVVDHTPVQAVSGVVELVYRNEQIFIASPLGSQGYTIAPNATIIVDNVQRTAAFIRAGMTINAVLNAQGQIISLVARTAVDIPTPSPTPSPTPTPTPSPEPQQPVTLLSDEGFVVSAAPAANPPTITILTQRVRITGQIVNEERTFTLAPNATITRGGNAVPLSDAQSQDIALFRYSGTVIHELELEDRVRTLEGILLERRPADHMGTQTILVEVSSGERYELRVLGTTEITRGVMRNLQLHDLRIGDSVTLSLEGGQLVGLHAEGHRSINEGRLTEILITQHLSKITVQMTNGGVQTFTVMPGIFDVYSLRIGTDIRMFLDSWEVLDIQVLSQSSQFTMAVLGYIQQIRVGQTIVVVDMDGQAPQSHTIVINNDTINTATGQRIDFSTLRVNMNVYIVMTGPQSNVAREITILP